MHSQDFALFPVAAYFRLGFLAAEHGALKGGVGCLALEGFGLIGEGVELADLIMDGAVAELTAEGRHEGRLALHVGAIW